MPENAGPINLHALIGCLQQHPPGQTVRLVETHISWVLITPDFAYKIKKPVKFSFVNFLTAKDRHHFCQEELRLNRRLAPEIYLAVVPVTLHRHSGQWSIDRSPGTEDCIVDWAVKMKTFRMDTLDQATTIAPHTMDAIADRLARFHGSLPPVPQETTFGTANDIALIVSENLDELSAMLPNDPLMPTITAWTHEELTRLAPFFSHRKSAGHIKECHGDLHLANIAQDNGAPILFDCIEFSERLRCIDVINEVAFLAMDLFAHGHDALAWRFINRWCETTGDYEGLRGLTFYSVYRALVRAKIHLHQNKPQAAQQYLATAQRLAAPRPVQLTLMHGFSGSGKTVVSQQRLETRGMIRIRSDVERKRLFPLAAPEVGQPALDAKRYGPEATRATFDYLDALATSLVQAGFPVVVDAAFLKRDLRARFIALAKHLGIPATILDVRATAETCRARIRDRQQHGQDASEATVEVFDQQQATAEPLEADELAITETTESTMHTSDLRDAQPGHSAR